jgi:putative transposase
MVFMEKSYKFRAYPSKEQTAELNRQMYLSKQLYNALLEKSKEHFKDTGKTFTKFDMNKWITKEKKLHPEYAEIYSQVLQNISDRISKAYQNFFRRAKEKRNGKKIDVGFPRFRKFVSSLTYPQSGFKVKKKTAYLSTIGNINFVNHREIEGKIKTCNIKKTKSGEWYITFSAEQRTKPFKSNGKEKAGMDLGLKTYAMLSDGSIFQNKKIPKNMELHKKTLQRRISRKHKGSYNRKKAVRRYAGYAEHISRIRQDFLHKLSYNLVNSYSFIAYEELNIAGMVKNHHLAKSISESSWGNFTQLLQYKAESAGCVAVGVNPKNTSQTCSECGNIEKIELKDRIFNCTKCSLQIDRDLNASKNILKRATEGHSGSYASGDIVRPSARKADAVESGTKFGGNP